MFLLFGNRYSDAIINVVAFVCGFCGKSVDQQVIERSNRFTLFFIPLFRISRSYVNVCSNCGGTTALTKQQAEHSLEWTRTHDAS